jgi:hypothetical protein
MDDDGTQPFGSHTEQPTSQHWDTDEWRAEMSERYPTRSFNEDLQRWIVND